MSTFEDVSFSLDNFSGTVRLFPLPNLVLFPHVMQPLHIFEPRYREMLEDALLGDGLISMVLLAPGWEKDYDGRPPLHPIACLGRITTHCRLADGTYNLLLLGLHRVKLLYELKPKRSFREAKVEIFEDIYPLQQADCHESLHHQLRDAFMDVLPLLPEAHEQLDQLIDADVSLGMLTDIISYMLNIDLEKKQSLLAQIDVYHRAELLLEYLWAAAEELHTGCPDFDFFPPLFSTN
jgi:Lon protease-like protein